MPTFWPTQLTPALIDQFILALTTAMRIGANSHEMDLAVNSARQMIERMDDDDFELLFLRYNTDDTDDPGGTGTAPGPHFAVEGLKPAPGDTDGMVGQIIFPESGGFLQENMTAAEFGLSANMDLNCDGDTDDSLTDDYYMLPVKIRMVWFGASGEWDYEMKAILIYK